MARFVGLGAVDAVDRSRRPQVGRPAAARAPGRPDGDAAGDRRHAPDPLHRQQGAQRQAPGPGPRPRLDPVRVRVPADRRGRRAADRRRTRSSGRSRPRPRPTPSSTCRSSSPSCARTRARSRPRWPAGCRSLITQADLRGDCHTHSEWSDGSQPIEAMAEACRRRGYAYEVLTDHSQSLAIANGLTPDRVAEERAIIAELNARFAAEEAAGTAPPETPKEGFRLLHGCELEVRADGDARLRRRAPRVLRRRRRVRPRRRAASRGRS